MRTSRADGGDPTPPKRNQAYAPPPTSEPEQASLF
jgi:hypothetical protein